MDDKLEEEIVEHLRKEENDLSRRKQTVIVSWEFLFAVAVNVIAVVWFMSSSQADQDARIQSLEAQQVTDARIARLEEKITTVIDNQRELKKIAQDLQRSEARAHGERTATQQ